MSWFMLAGAGVQALGALRSGSKAKAAARYNARMLRRSAAIARDQAAAEAIQHSRAARKTIGAMRAAYGASGVTVDGSALDVLEESVRLAEIDNQTIKYKGELRAIGAESAAALEEREGRDAFQASRLSAVGTLMSGYGSYMNRR